MRAAEIGSRHLERLLEAGADVFATDTRGRSCVHYAAAAGQDEALRVLVGGWGANAQLADAALGDQPVHCACREGRESTVRLLGGDLGVPFAGPEARRRGDGFSPLHEASRWGQAGCVKVLLSLAADRGRPAQPPPPTADSSRGGGRSGGRRAASSGRSGSQGKQRGSRREAAAALAAEEARCADARAHPRRLPLAMVNAEATVPGAAPGRSSGAAGGAAGAGGGVGRVGLPVGRGVTPIRLAAEYGHLQVR